MLHPINGTVHPQFELVRTAFSENFSLRGEVGAAVCIFYRGKKVVDLWGGFTDHHATEPWSSNDITTLFSVTKGIVATCFLMLVDRGIINYTDRIDQYWPELCQGPSHEQFKVQRAQLTIADLLNHRSGLLGFKDKLSLDTLGDEHELITRLESEPLRWPSGTQQGYHGVTFGLYSSVLFKKITGISIGQFLRDDIKSKLDIDLYLGLTPEEEHTLEPRLRPIFPIQLNDILSGILPSLLRSHREGRFFRSALNANSHTALAFGQPAALGAKSLKNFNTPKVRQLELPWANGLGSARGVSALYNGLLTPNKLVRSETLQSVFSRQSWTDTDAVIRKPMGFSYGFVKEEPDLFSPNIEAFGHPGAGGALGLADPKAHISIGYVMNRMGHQVRSPRALALCHALYRCL